MGPREECSLHPAVAVKPCELHPDHLGSSGLKPKSTIKAVAGKETLPTSVLRLQPDRVQCMVCHKCGLCCAARKHEVRNHSDYTFCARQKPIISLLDFKKSLLQSLV